MLLTTKKSIVTFTSTKKVFLLLIIILSSHICKSQIDSNITNCINALQDFNNSHFVEKVYLHSDKSIYSVEESIWFSVYLVNGNNLPIESNTVVYVELISSIDNKVISQRNIQLTNGLGNGDFYLPKNLFKGEYLIRAFTLYMKNFDHEFFFQKQIAIHSSQTAFQELPPESKSKEEGIDIQFFPEGGDLVSGFPTIIAFKATNQHGKSISVEGNIVNSNKDSVASFKTSHFGMGKFLLNPDIEEKYTAVCTYNGKEYKFRLPKSLDIAYQMAVIDSSNNINISVRCKNENQLQNSYIIGQSRGEIFTTAEIKVTNNYFNISIPKDSIPHGIAHFTFFDPNGSPCCERLIFVENKKDTEFITISTDKHKYMPKEKVKLNLNIYEELAVSDIKNLSLSVVASDYSNTGNKSINIHNYLLLNSDIKGTIENPSYYFNTENEDRLAALDLLMLTQGWRRFRWDELITHQYTSINYYPEYGFSINGQLVDFYQRKRTKTGKVSLIFLEHPLNSKTVKTDENGFFHFYGYDIMDTLNVYILADKIRRRKIENSKTRDALFIKYTNPFPAFKDYNWNINKTLSFKSGKFLNDTIYIYDKESTFIEEVKIISKKHEVVQHTLYEKPTHRISAEEDVYLSSSESVFSYLKSRVPSLKVIYDDITKLEYIQLRNKFSIRAPGDYETGALILINGVPLIDSNGLNDISMNDIEYIDILKNASAAIYGSRASEGVINIHLKQFSDNKSRHINKNFGIINFKHPGYYKAREFYSPKYENETISEMDQRTTLYWTPTVNINSEGICELEFYTSDIESDYTIQVEGISNNGQTIVTNYKFRSDDQEDFNFASQNE